MSSSRFEKNNVWQSFVFLDMAHHTIVMEKLFLFFLNQRRTWMFLDF